MSRNKLLVFGAIASFAIAHGLPGLRLRSIYMLESLPIALMATMTTSPPYCAPTAITARNGFVAASSLGAGSVFHGSNDFRGLVDTHSIRQYGYQGPLPKVGDKPAGAAQSRSALQRNEVRDGA